jgi:hypothetical protein
MKALRGRGGIAPIHSRSLHLMGVSGQRHAPTALYPRENDHGNDLIGDWVSLKDGLDTEATGKILCLCLKSS